MPEPYTWDQVAAGFDKNMPQEHYDKARREYFDFVVKPRLDNKSNPAAAWAEFSKITERPKASVAKSAAISAGQFAGGAAKGLLEPIAGLASSVKPDLAKVQKFDEAISKMAAREGKTNLPHYLGEFAGMAAPFTLGAEAVEASRIAEVTTSKLGQRMIRGAATFAAFDTASAQDGDRFVAGVKGAATGAVFEGAFGFMGKLFRRGATSENIDKIVTKLANGEAPTPDVDEEIADEIKTSAVNAKKEGRPKIIRENPNVQGVNVIVKDAEGKEQIVKVRPNAEGKASAEIQSYLRTGGEVEGIHFHPDSWSDTQKFMSKLANESEEKFAKVKIIRTEENQAPQLASKMRMEGKRVDAVGPSELAIVGTDVQKPSYTDLTAKLLDLNDGGDVPLSKGAREKLRKQVDTLWSDAVPAHVKERIAHQLRYWEELQQMLPPDWQRPLEQPGPESGPELAAQEAEQLGISEVEKARLEEIATKSREARITNPGQVEEAARKGEIPGRNFAMKIPRSEFMKLDESMREYEVLDQDDEIKVTNRERRIAVSLPPDVMEEIYPGAAGAVMDPSDPLTELFEPGMPRNIPKMVYPRGVTDRSTIYHEGLHVDMYHTPSGKTIVSGENETAEQIGHGLREYPVYRDQSGEIMREEAFVFSAEAIRMNDSAKLAELVRYDTSVENVTKMVNEVADKLLLAARSSDWYAPSRVVQRKMSDLLLRTSPDRIAELADATKNQLKGAWFDPDQETWRAVESNGSQRAFSNFKQLADYLYDNNGTQFAPSHTAQLEMKGVRGPFTPRGGSPGGVSNGGGQIAEQPDVRWKGWTAVSGLFRPMQPWVADLDKRVNEALSSKGMSLPIFDKWKNLSEADRAYEVKARDMYDEAANILEGVGKKQYDFFDVLTTDPKHWKTMQQQLKLSEDDMQKVVQLDEWLRGFRDKTGINPFNYLRDELPRMKGHGFNTEFVYGPGGKKASQMSTFERLIDEGKLDPQNRHIGTFMDTLIREARMQELRKPMTELRQLVDKKARDGSYVLGDMRYPLDNYIKYMSGIPDITSKVMKQGISDFQGFLGRRAEQMNKHLPDWAQLPTEFQYPGAILNKLMVWSYAAGLGLRASIPVRDAMQVFSTTLPVLGPTRFAKGLAYLAENGMSLANESGALLGRKNMGDLYGDIFSELPVGSTTDKVTQLAQKLLSPSRAGHNLGRAVGFYGEYFGALDAIRDYKSGSIDLDELIQDKTHLWFNDEALTKRMVDLIHNAPPEEAAKQIALEMVDLTLWPYRRGMQPTMLRTGAGRIFGQFGMWPLNYADFLRRATSKTAQYPKQALQMAGLFAATNYAAVQSFQAVGIDSNKWFFISPSGYGMSPHAQFILDLAKSPEETPDGRAARKRVLEYPMDFFPGGVEMRNIEDVLKNDEAPFDSDGRPTPALVKVLGFKPLKETPDRDMEDQIKFELGLKGERRQR